MIVKERSDIMDRYYTYKQYLINKFNDKTYKLPIQIPVTCPNRDGTISHEGCYFCSEKGTGFEAYSSMVPISKQLEMAKEKVVKRYKAKKFIAYFQNYTNTYLPVNTLLTYLEEAPIPNEPFTAHTYHLLQFSSQNWNKNWWETLQWQLLKSWTI